MAMVADSFAAVWLEAKTAHGAVVAFSRTILMTKNPISESVSRRIVGSLFITQSLFSAAFIASFTIMSITAAELSGSDSMAGVPSTLALLARAATAYPIGWLMDRIGRRMGLSLGYALGGVGVVIAALSIFNRKRSRYEQAV
jgi:MFS family permease